MDHSTLMGDRLANHQQSELARTLELRRSIAARREAQEEAILPASAPARGRRWHGLLVRAHLVHPLTH